MHVKVQETSSSEPRRAASALGICFFCLTHTDREVEAVTLRSGTSVCKACAREWGDQLRS